MNTDDVQQEQEAVSPFPFKAALIGVGLLVAGLVVYLLSSGPRVDPKKPLAGDPSSNPNPREAALEILQRETHLSACRNALQKLNDYLGQARTQPVPSLSTAAKSLLQESVKLAPDELGEVEQPVFTALDGHYLESCFLLRDAARLLEAWPSTATLSERPDPAERARAAFAWVVRQVRLVGPSHRSLDFIELPPLTQPDQLCLPPQFALRVGGDTCWDRALVFLSLLDQLGVEEAPAADLLGCLVVCPDDKGKLQLWACGVLSGRDVYLFDPELGLPLPGPDGKGVATLADVRKDPKKVLAQLNVSDKRRYDVKPEQAAKASVYLAPALSSLAPRMRLLQDELLASVLRIRLAHDAQRDLDRMQAANGVEKGSVQLWAPAMTVLRRFLPREEGGTDSGLVIEARKIPGVRGFASVRDESRTLLTLPAYVRLKLVPWSFFPPLIRENDQLPAIKGLGEHLRKRFEAPFVESALEPGQARDLLLRGNLGQAVNELTQERVLMEMRRQRLHSSRDLLQQADSWVREAASIRARMLRIQGGKAEEKAQLQHEVEAMDKKAGPMVILLEGAQAIPRLAEVAYLIAQCKMEQAERLQARLDYNLRSKVTPTPKEREEVENAWRSALFWWKKYLEDYPATWNAPCARLHQARALVMLGKKDDAIQVLRDLSGIARQPEAVARLYLARQLEKKVAAEK